MFTDDGLLSCHLEELNIVQVKHEKGGWGGVFGVITSLEITTLAMVS